MPDAAIRNAVPHVLELPSVPDNAFLFIHEALADEENKFQLTEMTEVRNELAKYWSFSFLQEQKIIQVLFTYNYHEHGKPDRGAFKIPLLKLKQRETGQFLINGRHTSYSGQFYMQYSINFANVEKCSPRIFLDNQANYIVDKLENLF